MAWSDLREIGQGDHWSAVETIVDKRREDQMERSPGQLGPGQVNVFHDQDRRMMAEQAAMDLGPLFLAVRVGDGEGVDADQPQCRKPVHELIGQGWLQERVVDLILR